MAPEQIIELADTCVKCGLCLPRCPTYRKTLQELDSPRGRIALIQGLLNGSLPETPRVAESLDQCLECHACESFCPSGTQVTRIIDAIRALRREKQNPLERWLRLELLNTAVRPRLFMPLIKYYQKSNLRSWLQTSSLLRLTGLEYAEQLLPQLTLKQAQLNISTSKNAINTQQQLAIFPGCLGNFLDAQALEATSKILHRLGYQTFIPAQPCCCGALHRHDGFAVQADLELKQSTELFVGYQKILTVASACLDGLRQSQDLVNRVTDATTFIASQPWPAELILDATPQTVWIHVPCTQRHPIGDPLAALKLLQRIPGIVINTLPDNDTCCGAAGTYMLRQPKLSQALIEDKLQLIEQTHAAVVLTTNTGCALRLATSLNAKMAQVRVCHPLEILAERIADPL